MSTTIYESLVTSGREDLDGKATQVDVAHALIYGDAGAGKTLLSAILAKMAMDAGVAADRPIKIYHFERTYNAEIFGDSHSINEAVTIIENGKCDRAHKPSCKCDTQHCTVCDHTGKDTAGIMLFDEATQFVSSNKTNTNIVHDLIQAALQARKTGISLWMITIADTMVAQVMHKLFTQYIHVEGYKSARGGSHPCPGEYTGDAAGWQPPDGMQPETARVLINDHRALPSDKPPFDVRRHKTDQQLREAVKADLVAVPCGSLTGRERHNIIYTLTQVTSGRSMPPQRITVNCIERFYAYCHSTERVKNRLKSVKAEQAAEKAQAKRQAERVDDYILDVADTIKAEGGKVSERSVTLRLREMHPDVDIPGKRVGTVLRRANKAIKV